MFFDGSKDGQDKFRSIFSPKWVDYMLRQAIALCWATLPRESRTATEIQTQVWRIVERALKDQREDADVFGTGRAP